MPLNFLLIEPVHKHDDFLDGNRRVRLGGVAASLWQVVSELSQRLIRLFTRDTDGRRSAHGHYEKCRTNPHWNDLMLFDEYFNDDNGICLGASHQTGWTALMPKLIEQHAEVTPHNRAHQGQPGFGLRRCGPACSCRPRPSAGKS